MEEVTRKRLIRKLEALPEEQLYQVMDFIEFVEAKYARAAGQKPDPFQQFAERVEDQMRMRSLAPRAMKGTMRVMSTAGKVIDGVRELGRDLVRPPATRRPNGASGRPDGARGEAGGSSGGGGGARAGGGEGGADSGRGGGLSRGSSDRPGSGGDGRE